MAHITTAEAQAWFASTKLATPNLQLDASLEEQISNQVLASIQGVYDTSLWVNDQTTPNLVRSVIAMLYAAWVYDRQYSDENGESDYADELRERANALLDGIVRGIIDLPDPGLVPLGAGQPAFFPDDASSSTCPTVDSPSDGPPVFMMGAIF